MESLSSLLGSGKKGFVDENMIMILPKNSKKYVGHIREFDNRYTFEYLSQDMKVKELFYFEDLGSKENAYNSALLFQKKWCQNNNMITNIYYVVNNEYILVELNNHQKMKVDLEDIPYIEEYNWRIQNNSPFPSTFQLINGKRTFITFHKMKYQVNRVHYKNNDKFDLRTENVIPIH